MRTALLCSALVALALALAGTGSAAAIEIRLGDTVDIAGTQLACFAAESGGIKGIGCFKANTKGLVPGTFGAALGEGRTEHCANQASSAEVVAPALGI